MTKPQYERNQTRWDARFISLAKLAASWSEDKSRQVGAVIVGEANEVRSVGFNGLARGVASTVAERHAIENNEKYFWKV